MKPLQEELGHGGPERTVAGEALPDGKYFCIVPQEALTITSITPLQGFTATNYNSKTLIAGVPFFIPFRTCTLTGAADVYKATSRVLIDRFNAR